MLRAQLRARQLERELAPPPQLAQVRHAAAAGRRGAARRRGARAPNSWRSRLVRGSGGSQCVASTVLALRLASSDDRRAPGHASSATACARAAAAAAARAPAPRRGSPRSASPHGAGERSARQPCARANVDDVERAQRQRQVAAGEPARGCARRSRASSRGGPAAARRGVQDGDVARVADAVAGVQDAPGEVDALVHEAELGRPAADGLEHAAAASPRRPPTARSRRWSGARSPTRRRGTQSRSGAPPSQRVHAQLQRRRASGRAANARRRGRARRARRGWRRRRGRTAARRARAARRRCGRPGCRRRSGRRDARARRPGRPAGSQPLPTTTTSSSTPRWSRSDRARARRASGRAPRAEHDAAERHRSRSEVRIATRWPSRGDRGHRHEHPDAARA